MRNKLNVIEHTKEVINLLANTIKVDEGINELNLEIEVVSSLVTKLVNGNSTRVQNQEEKGKEKSYKEAKGKALNSLIVKMEELDSSLLEWSDDIWMLFIDFGIVHKD